MPLVNDVLQRDIDSPFVELYVIDATKIGGTMYYFTPSINLNQQAILWQGNAYAPLPITSSGWEANADGTMPQPQISLSNVNKVMLGAVIANGDLVGSTVYRYKTLAKYLDQGSSPDMNQHFPPDIGVISQKIKHDKTQITWQLSTPLDRFGIQLPRRQMLVNGNGDPNNAFPGLALF